MAQSFDASKRLLNDTARYAGRTFLMETLEARQMLSGSMGHESILHAAMHSAPAALVSRAHPDKASSTTAAERLAQQEAAKLARQAAANAKKQAAIAKDISAFVAKITAEARKNPAKDTAKFQAHVASQQTAFAAQIARKGGSYTPIPFSQLLLGTVQTVPAPVLNGTAASASEIDLSWAAIASAVSYKIETTTDNVTWTLVASTTSTSYSVFNLLPSTAYSYRVTAYTAAAASSPSNTKIVTTLLAAPTNFTAVATSTSNINLSWTAVAGVSTYKIERSPDGSTWNTLSPSPALGSSSTSYSDAGVSAGQTYYYRISSVESTGTSAPSSIVVAPTYATAPVLTAVPISTLEIDLSWPAVPSAYSYRIDTSTDDATWSTLATQTANTYQDINLSADTKHYFRVTAINAAGNSAYSNEPAPTTLLNPPTGLAVAAASTTEIDLSWIPVTDAASYKIERSTDDVNFSPLTLSPSLNGASASYKDLSLSPGTAYYYEILSVDAAGNTSVASSPAVSTITLPPAMTLTATFATTSTGTLTWTQATGATSYKIEESTNGGSSWTTLNNQSTLTYALTNLALDTTYTFRVTASNASGSSIASNTQVLATILPAVTNFNATAASAQEIDLTWTPIADATSYKIARSPDGTNWTTLVAAQPGISDHYADTSVSPGTTYHYQISAVDAAGTSATAVTGAILTPPATPTNLAANATSSTAVTVTWTASTGTVSSYKLESSSDGGVTWVALSPAPTGATATYTGLNPDTIYKYRVSATNATATSSATAVVSATTFLNAPAGFSGTVISATGIDLSWTAEVDATSYKVERSTNNSTWASVTGSPFSGATTFFADTGLTAGTTYYYRISSIDAAGTSVTTGTAALVTLPATPVIAAPTVPSANEIDLSWSTSASVTGYKVEKSSNGGTTWTTAVATQTGTTYSATGLSPDTAYQFRVTALNGSVQSAVSAIANATTLLSAPSSLAATVPSGTEIDLAWGLETDAISYKIDSSLNGTTWTTVVASQTGNSYSATGLTVGTVYYYRVSAIDAAGTSAPTATGATPTLPAAPVLTAAPASTTSVNLSWTAPPTASSYLIDRSSDGGNTWTALPTPTGTTAADASLNVNTIYQYRIYAINSSGTSPSSAIVNANTALPVPTNFLTTPISATEIDLAWKVVTAATSYKIERSVGGTNWTTLAPLTALTGTSIAYADTSVLPGVTYTYRISTIDGANVSTPSATVTGLTFPAAPTLAAAPQSGTQINLSWNAVATATSYKLESSSNGGSTWTTTVTQAGLTYNNTGLTAGTIYKYRVSAINASGATVSAIISATAELLDPMTLTATATSTSVTLSWTAVANVSSYAFQRSTDGATWSTLSTPSLNSSGVSYTDTYTITAGTIYYYKLTATDSLGTQVPAGTIQVTTAPAQSVLTAAAVSASEIDLSWPAVSTATSYFIERSTDNSTWLPLNTQAGTTYSDTNLISDKPYYYRVTAINGSGSGTVSTVQSATTFLVAPSAFSALVVSATGVDLSWTSVNDATTYVIQRSLDNSAWTTLVPSPALNSTSLAYADTTLTAGTTYYYRISAKDAAGTSAPANSGAVLTLPAEPTLTATPASPTRVNLSWTASASTTTYLLERSTDGGITWANATSLINAPTTSFGDTNVLPGQTYVYRVTATNATGNSLTSATQTATTPLASPTSFTPVVVSGTEVDLSWVPVAGATTYKIERSLNNSTWTTLVPSPILNGSSNFYADTSVAAGTTYYYRISASNGANFSAVATASAVTTLAATPTLTATVVSATAVTLTWTASASATSYKVESSTNGGNTWLAVSPNVSAPTITYAYTALSPDTQYEFRVSAVNPTGTSSPSTVRTVTTLLPAVTNFAAAVISPTEIDLSWTAVPDATGYLISRSLNNSTWTALTTTSLNSTSTTLADTGVAAGTTYYYRIAATDAAGTSAYASIANPVASLPVAPVLALGTVSSTTVNLVWNAVTGAANYKIEKSVNSGSSWTTVVASQSATTLAATVTPDTAYEFRVTAINSALALSAASNAVSVTTLLAAPTGLSASVISATEIDLSWPAETDATGYKVERSLNGTTWTTLAANQAATTYNDTVLASGTSYTYRISAIDAVGTSAVETATAVSTLPAAPTVTALAISTAQINLSWPAVVGAADYMIEKSINGGGSYTTLVTSQAGATYQATGLSADTSYKFRVTAIATGGATSVSTVVTQSTLLAAPAAPTLSVASANEIDLSWTAITDAVTITVQRSVNNTVWTTVTGGASLAGTATSFPDTTVLAGTTYYYHVTATDAAGTSLASASASALTLPAAPVGTATPASATSMTLTWPAILSATGYKVETSVDGGFTWATLVADDTTPSYANTLLAADTAYKYRVSAINGAGTGAPSATFSGTTLLLPPTNLAAASSSTTAINLTWNAETDATSYKIEYSTNNSTWTTLVPSPALNSSSVSYINTGLTAGTTYYYRISAQSAGGFSVPSAVVTLPTLPAAPANFADPAVSATQMNLSWTASVGATSYEVDEDIAGTWTKIANPTTTTYQATGLTSDTPYAFRVEAIDAAGLSASTTASPVTTFLTAPTNFAASPVSATEIDLTWTAVTDATNYKLEYSTDNSTWNTIVQNTLTGTSAAYNDTSLSANTKYYFRISATDAAGSSAPSAEITSLTYPSAPVVTATAVSTVEVDFAWPAIPAATGYTVETSTDGSTWSSPSTQAGTSVHVTGLTADSVEDIQVSATNASGTGAYCTPLDYKSLLAAPATFVANATSATSITLGFTAVTDATSFVLQRSQNQTTWVTLNTSALTASSTSFIDSGLTAGTIYYYRMQGANAYGTSLASITNTVTYPAAPVLTATATAYNSIGLSWTAPLSETSYGIETSTDGSTWGSVITPSGATYSDSGLTADTAHYYKVEAINASGDSVFSNVVQLKTLLAAPGSFTAAGSSATSIVLAFSANTDATSITIQRSTDQSTWTTLNTSSLNASSTSFTDTGVSGGTTYYYRTSATDQYGTSAYSTANALTVPAAPTLTATATSTAQINLSWTAPTGVVSYSLETSTDGSTWGSPIVPTGTTYSDTSLNTDSAHYYKIEAVDATGDSVFSNTAVLNTLLAAPTTFAAAASSPTAIALSWDAETDATGFKLERSTGSNNWVTVQNTGLTGSSTSYTDTGLTPGANYSYRLSAISAYGTSLPCTAIPAQTFAAIPTLTASVASSSVINLSWTASATATGYTVMQSTDGSNWTPVVTQATAGYQVTGLNSDSVYEYEILATNPAGSTAYGAAITADTLSLTPTTFVYTATSATENTLGWATDADATGGYKIQRSLNQTVWTTLNTSSLTSSSTSFNDTTVTPGTTYYYTITAIGTHANSAASGILTTLTLPAAPTLAATPASATSVNLSWNAQIGATSYTIEHSTDGGTNWLPSPVITVNAPLTSYLDAASLAANTTYEYEITANNASGSSTASTASVTTLLASPSGFTAAATSATVVSLAWSTESGATGYRIDRSLNGTTWTTINSPAANATSYNDNTASAGTTYYYRIASTDAVGASAPTTPAAQVLTVPTAPTLSAVAASAIQVNLSWSASFGATTYSIESSTDNLTWSSPISVSAPTTTYPDTTVSANTLYYYQITANNATGSSTESTAASVTTLVPTPGAFTATPHSATQINLAWSTVTGATNFKIERSLNGSTWLTLPNTNLTGSSTSYSDTSVSAGTNYYYRISSISAAGTSAPTAVMQALTMPAAPVISVTTVTAASISISWTTMQSATGYTLETSTDGTTWTPNGGITQTNTTYTFGSLTTNTEYYFQVTANNASGASAESTAVTQYTLLTAPATPIATPTSGTTVHLTWTADPNATTYKVERSTSATTGWQTISAADATNSCSDTGLTAGTLYYYRVSSTDAAGTSLPSTVASVTTLLAAPANLVATAASTTQINLTWTKDTAVGLTGFILYISTDNSTFTAYETLGVTATSTSIAGLTATTPYYFQLVAVNAGGDSSPSTTATATTL